MTIQDFQLRWRVTPKTWRELAAIAAANPRGSYLDRHDHTSDLLLGQLQILVGGEPLFLEYGNGSGLPNKGPACAVLAVALQLVKQRHLIFMYQNGEVARVRGIDTGGFLSAHKYGDKVMVSSLPPQGVRRLTCTVDGFVKGMHRFIDEVITEIDRKAPGILTWETLDDLFYFRPINQPDLWQTEFAAVPPAKQFRRVPKGGPFQISWAMFDSEWATVRRERSINPPGSELDARLSTAEFLFGGYVRFYSNGVEIPVPPIYRNVSARNKEMEWLPDFLRQDTEPPHRVWTTLDFALQLARFVRPQDFRKLKPGQRTMSSLHGGDPRRFLAFDDVEAYSTQILPDRIEDLRQHVGAENFDIAAREFLDDFATVIHQRVPEAFDWWSLQPLRRYIQGEGNAD